jgi:hypothetical protein
MAFAPETVQQLGRAHGLRRCLHSLAEMVEALKGRNERIAELSVRR